MPRITIQRGVQEEHDPVPDGYEQTAADVMEQRHGAVYTMEFDPPKPEEDGNIYERTRNTLAQLLMDGNEYLAEVPLEEEIVVAGGESMSEQDREEIRNMFDLVSSAAEVPVRYEF